MTDSPFPRDVLDAVEVESRQIPVRAKPVRGEKLTLELTAVS